MAANLLALDYPREGIFNLGTGRETDILTVYLKLQEITDSSHEPVHGLAKPGEQRRSALDCTWAREEMGWQPRYPWPKVWPIPWRPFGNPGKANLSANIF